MNQSEDRRLADRRIREHLIRIGHIVPANRWEAELAEYEEDNRNTRTRGPSRPNLRLVYSGEGRGR